MRLRALREVRHRIPVSVSARVSFPSMIRFENLLEKVRSYSSDADVELLRRAYVFSALEHKGQVRHSGEPYLVHPLEVANLLADMKLDVEGVAAGLLHDVVEDTLTTTERIAELFGPEV